MEALRERFEDFGIVEYEGYTLVNTTPHQITILDSNGSPIVVVPPARNPLRIDERVKELGKIGKIPLVEKSLAWPKALYAGRVPETFLFIVPLVLAERFRLPFFVVPDDFVRDSEGRIIGCRRLAQVL